MSKKKDMMVIIDQILELIDNAVILTVVEKDFIKIYRENFEMFKFKIANDEIDIKGTKSHTGLFKWIGEYDDLVNNNQELYNAIYKMEEIYSSS